MARNSVLHDAFCENVKKRRRLLGLTQQEVADALGVSQPSYAQIESGRRMPGLDVVERVAQALDVLPADLLGERSAVA